MTTSLHSTRDGAARSIEESFLSNVDLQTEMEVARIQLNLEDNDYFGTSVCPEAGP